RARAVGGRRRGNDRGPGAPPARARRHRRSRGRGPHPRGAGGTEPRPRRRGRPGDAALTSHPNPDGEGETLASRPVHDGRIVHLSIDTVRFPDGSTGELEMIRHSGAAAVLPVLDSLDDPDPRVLLVHQFRYAGGGYLYEVPAGRPDR